MPQTDNYLNETEFIQWEILDQKIDLFVYSLFMLNLQNKFTLKC